MKNTSTQKEDQLHLSVYSALEGLGISVHKSKKARNKRRRSSVKADIARGRLCSTSCEKEDYPFIASPKQKLFGIVLNSVEWDMDCNGFYAPKFLIMVTEYLLLHQKCEGIFRKPGTSNRLKGLKILLEDGGNLSTVGVSHVYDVACILKQWLRELPEPLIPYAFHEMFLTCYDIKQEEDRLKALCLACLLLPSEHLRTLMYILKFLSAIAKEEVNRMDALNLALVMSPCVMPLPKLSVDSETTKLLLQSRTHIIKLLILHSERVGKTEWLEDTLANGYSMHSELAQRKAKLKGTSKSVHSIFRNLRKKIGHVQSPSLQDRSSLKSDKSFSYSQSFDRQKGKKPMHSPYVLNEFDDVIVPKTGLTPLKLSSTGSTLKPLKLSVESSGNETANSSLDTSVILSPLLNITNSSFNKESPFSRTNKFRLENERAWLQSNSDVQSAEPCSPLTKKDADKDDKPSEGNKICNLTTPVCSQHGSRRSRSLHYGSSREREAVGTSRNNNIYKPSNLMRKNHHMKAKYRRDSCHSIKLMSNLMRSASSPASCLDLSRVTSQLERRAAIAWRENYRDILMSELVSCTDTKSALKRGRPNTKSSGLPSPTWTRSKPCDSADVSIVEAVSSCKATSVTENRFLSSPPNTIQNPRDVSPNGKLYRIGDSPHARGSSVEAGGDTQTVVATNDAAVQTEVEKKHETPLRGAHQKRSNDIERNVPQETNESEKSQMTPMNDKDPKCTSNPNTVNTDMKEPEFKRDNHRGAGPWTDAKSYFRMPERGRVIPRNYGNVRESILMLRTQNAGRVQENVQLFDNMASTFSVPVARRLPTSKYTYRSSFAHKKSDACATLKNKPSIDCKSPLGGSRIFPSDKRVTNKHNDKTGFVPVGTHVLPVPRALFACSSYVIDKDPFASTEDLLLSETQETITNNGLL